MIYLLALHVMGWRGNFINCHVVVWQMAYPLIDDVRELLEKGKGDERILNQILRACENDEVISNYERSYVKKLVDKHLSRKTNIGSAEPVAPKVEIIPPAPATEVAALASPTSHSSSKNIKIVGIGAALIIAVAVSVAILGSSDNPADVPVNPIDTPIVDEPEALLIQTDLLSYQKGDLVSISGSSVVPGSVNLYITNSDDQLVWSERVTIKGNGGYSTLTIAGGSGWENPGTFTIGAENNSESVSMTFSFTG